MTMFWFDVKIDGTVFPVKIAGKNSNDAFLKVSHIYADSILGGVLNSITYVEDL